MYSGASRSATGTPQRIGGPDASPVTAIRPDSACTRMSMPLRFWYLLGSPKALIDA
ncbi:Uncharacterised protein [Mycobacteroides abscessus subsp. abscessus]|nr:Uncharacterised protein [Mycobacteroides abscessus subsp. abscessus]